MISDFNKLKFLLLGVLISLSQIAFSQAHEEYFDNPVINFKAALNYYHLGTAKDSTENGIFPSFSIGLIKRLGQHFFTQINLNYNSSGYRRIDSLKYQTFKTNNLGIDIGLDYYPIDLLGIRIGAEPIYLLSSKIIYGTAGSNAITNIPIRSNGFNIVLSGGLTFKLSEDFSIYFNYNYSLMGNNKINNYYQLGLNFRVPFNSIIKNSPKTSESKEQAYSQIKKIKSNALLIKLPKYDIQMVNAKDTAKYKYGRTVLENQEKTNDSIYYNFKNYFNFCPVYFYYGTNYQHIKKGQIQGYLLNEQLIPDTSIKFPYTKYFLGGFEELQTDTDEYIEALQYFQKNELKIKKNKNGSSVSVSDQSNHPFIISDKFMTPLKSPFPYNYKMNVLFDTRLIKKLVLKINQDFNNFYYQATKKQLARKKKEEEKLQRERMRNHPVKYQNIKGNTKWETK